METLYHDSLYNLDMGSQLRLARCSVTRKVSPCDRDLVFRVTDMGHPQVADRNRAIYRWFDRLPILFDILDCSFPRASKRFAGTEGERREIKDWRD
jgi:hypothetical protein